MKNLILGSSGFIGKYLVQYLRGLNEEVIEFDIKNGVQEDCRTSKIDLNGVDRVYILAWNVGGAKYLYRENNQLSQLTWNLEILDNLIKQIKGVPFVFVSSQLAENCDLVYGITKRVGEVWVKNSNNGNAIRLWNVYGILEEQNEKTHVISDFIYQAQNFGVIKMMTDGSEERQFIHIKDVCFCLRHSFDLPRGEVYDLSPNEWIKISTVAEKIGNYFNVEVLKGKIKGHNVRITSLKKIPQWSPSTNFEQGLEELLRYFEPQSKTCQFEVGF